MRGDERGFLIITHYTRILEYVKPDFVHILLDGRIVREGGSELADELEDKGYEFVREEVGARWRLASSRTAGAPRWRSTSRRRSRPGAAPGSGRRRCAGSTSTRSSRSATSPRLPCSRPLGDEEHSALIVQRGANVVHTDLDDDQIVVMPLEQAVEEHPDLVEPHFGKRLPYDEGKFAAGTARSGPAACSSTCRRTCGREADPGRLADRRARARSSGRTRSWSWASTPRCASASTSSAATSRARRCTPARSSSTRDTGAQVDLAHYQDWGSGEVFDLST